MQKAVDVGKAAFDLELHLLLLAPLQLGYVKYLLRDHFVDISCIILKEHRHLALVDESRV